MPKVLQLQISLQVLPQPDIQRVLLIPDDINFFELHCIIQLAFGWTNSHSHEFRIPGKAKEVIGNILNMEEADMPKVLDSRKIKVREFLKTGSVIQYEYDFGDSWNHVITVEDILDCAHAAVDPVCISGKGNCPPEDCGSIHGFNELVEAMKKGKGEVFDDFVVWLGQRYYPEEFDLAVANHNLKSWKKYAKKWGPNTFPK